QKVGIEAAAALTIVRVAQGFLKQLSSDSVSSLRPCLMIANICKDHDVAASVDDPDFRDLCRDILLSRADQSIKAANEILWTLFNQFSETTNATPEQDKTTSVPQTSAQQVSVQKTPEQQVLSPVALAQPSANAAPLTDGTPSTPVLTATATVLQPEERDLEQATVAAPDTAAPTPMARILAYLNTVPQSRLSEIELQTGLNRVAVVNGLRTLIQQQRVEKQDIPGKPATYRAK
ncbi:MAG: hypothetical protein AAFZ80_10200, partial [Cyanobacteria bacterium P01_A01_bin.105]